MAEFNKGPILGDEQLTALEVSSAFASIPAGATFAVIQVESQAVRFRPNSLTPTPDVGFLLDAGTITTLEEAPLSALRFIQVEDGAVINVLYF